ncbi:MAG: SDR family NAD(P)-dependent oxidoreductase [Bacteroidales bacterium]|jgi:NADP-dependent 3-hydroxy acid dehydrogenase YdfG|nr:SDR family NAD(P)-dependent oxidoreductase [Bacteroidales bacterium]
MNKTLLVTGATSGFGRAIAARFANNGFNVIITGRRKERLAEVESELLKTGTGKVVALNFDVRNAGEVNAAIGSLPQEWKKIDILVNNAGLAAGSEHIDQGSTDDWDRMIDTNLKGLLYVTKAVAPLMVEAGSGHIINIGSIAGKEPYESGNVYCASKAAVKSLSKSMRIDLVKHNIKVTCIEPGMAETEFALVRFHGDAEKAKSIYKGIDAMTADDIAGIVYWCATLPAHVCINELEVTPTQQATIVHKNIR